MRGADSRDVLTSPSCNTKFATVADIVGECQKAIEKYHLDSLLAKAKASGIPTLAAQNKESLIAGLIEVGEILTFCRDHRNRRLSRTGIIPFAIQFAKIRNHLVHHQVYHEYFKVSGIDAGEPHQVFQEKNLLEMHTNLVHKGTELSKPCDICQKNFLTLGSYSSTL